MKEMKTNVLIIDDDKDFSRSLSDSLEESGFQVKTANNPKTTPYLSERSHDLHHAAAVTALLGLDPLQELAASFSSEQEVEMNAQTPFKVMRVDDVKGRSSEDDQRLYYFDEDVDIVAVTITGSHCEPAHRHVATLSQRSDVPIQRSHCQIAL